MSYLFLATLNLWELLLKSMVPLLMTTVALSIAVYLLIPWLDAQRRMERRTGFLLAAGNLLAATCWCLLYADTLFPWQHPAWSYGAPLTSMMCLLLLPWLALRVMRGHRENAPNQIERFSLRFSLIFHAVSLVPGLYLAMFYVVLYSGKS